MIWVVGAVAIDLIAVREKFLDGTSNPSDIRLGLGGVGYRVFSNLEAPRRFITALAGDPISRWAREALEADGDAIVQSVTERDARPPLYLALMESGSLKVAASDFRIMERALDPSWVAERIGSLAQTDFLLLDANLSQFLLADLLGRYAASTRVVFEPVSVEKAARHAAGLRGLHLATPTPEELAALLGRADGDPRDGEVFAFMDERRVANILVTRGREGASLYSGGARQDFAPGRVVDAPDTTGAGDLLDAALLSTLHRGVPMAEAVRAAMTAVEARLAEGER